MNYNEIKLSDVIKALRNAGFTKLDVDAAMFGDRKSSKMCFYKYKGGLYIIGENVGFCINSKAYAKISGAYSTSAIDADGAACENITNCPRIFFIRLFGYLKGEIREAEIIAEICE